MCLTMSNDLLDDHLELLRNHEPVLKLLACSLDDSKKLAAKLKASEDLSKRRLCNYNDLRTTYQSLKDHANEPHV